jgi:hypothetical protein
MCESQVSYTSKGPNLEKFAAFCSELNGPEPMNTVRVTHLFTELEEPGETIERFARSRLNIPKGPKTWRSLHQSERILRPRGRQRSLRHWRKALAAQRVDTQGCTKGTGSKMQ